MNPIPRLARATVVAAVALTAGVLAPAGIASAKTIELTCKGNAEACTTVLKLGGGASNANLKVALPAFGMRLTEQVAYPHWIQGAYAITNVKYLQDGGLFSAKLNAVQSIPRNGRVTLLFEMPSTSLGCKSVTKNIGYLSIAARSGLPQGVQLSCQTANAVANTWYLRFQNGTADRPFSVNGTRYNCDVVPRVPQNFLCTGGAYRIRFAGPTGR